MNRKSLFGFFYSCIELYCRDEVYTTAVYAARQPGVVFNILIFSLLGYVSLTFVLSLIQYFGATEAELVKCFRKILSIIFSFLMFPKPVNQNYIFGFLAVCVSLLFSLKGDKLKVVAL